MEQIKNDFTLETIGIPQSELWTLEEQLNQIKGIKSVDLREAKDTLHSITTLIIEVTKDGGIIALGIQQMATVIHNILQNPKNNEKERKIVLSNKDGRKVELVGYSLEEIKQILRKFEAKQ